MDMNLGLTHWATVLYGGLERKKNNYIMKIIFYKSNWIIIRYLPKMEGHRWQQWEMANHLGRIQISTHAIQAADRPNDLSNTIHFDCRCSISNKLQARNGFLTKTTMKGIAMIKVWCNKSTNYLFLSSASDKNNFRVRLLSSAEESSLSIRSLFLKYTLELKKKKKGLLVYFPGGPTHNVGYNIVLIRDIRSK